MADPLFAEVDQDAAEDLAGRFMAAVLATVEFARPDSDSDDYQLFEVAIAMGLIEALAAYIAHDHQDPEQHEEFLEQAVTRLRARVAEIGAEQ